MLKQFSGLFVIVFIMSCGGKKDEAAKQQAPPPIAVNVADVTEGNATYYDQYPATVNALNEVEIRPQVSGSITGIFFKDGQHVVKGQKLYSIDQQQYRGQYEQAVANLNVTKANLAKAQQDADRYNELAKQDAIARQTLDHAVADLQSSKMSVEAAKANVSSVATNLKYANITSPLTGTIGISQVKLGAAVAPGQTVLNTVSADDPLAVDFAVDEKEIARFVTLQRNGMKPSDSIFTLLLPDGNAYTQSGSISVIDRAVDPQTGTIRMRLVFPNQQGMLRTGMSCTVRVKNAGNTPQVMIPYKAVVEQMGEYFVYVLGDSSKVAQHKVALGTRINDKVIVKSGVKAGEKIVVDGVQKVRDGAAVQIAKNPADTAGSKMTTDTSAKAKK
jgi:RND family efflux transporter MFP subunit